MHRVHLLVPSPSPCSPGWRHCFCLSEGSERSKTFTKGSHWAAPPPHCNRAAVSAASDPALSSSLGCDVPSLGTLLSFSHPSAVCPGGSQELLEPHTLRMLSRHHPVPLSLCAHSLCAQLPEDGTPRGQAGDEPLLMPWEWQLRAPCMRARGRGSQTHSTPTHSVPSPRGASEEPGAFLVKTALGQSQLTFIFSSNKKLIKEKMKK